MTEATPTQSLGRVLWLAGLLSIGAALLMMAGAALSAYAGSESVDVAAGWRGWWAYRFGDEPLPMPAAILDLRLMRTAMALIAGGALAITGAAFQGILRNPLVEPSTLGVSSAAAVGAFWATLMEWELPGRTGVQACAFFAAIVDVLVVYGLARLSGRFNMTSLLLSGITLSFMASAAIMLMIHVSDPYKIQTYELWLLGSLQIAAWSRVLWCLVLVAPAVAVLLWQAHNLNPIALGDSFAEGRGVRVERTQALIFIAGSMATAGVVSVVGPIAFVGLIVPHFVRRLVGSDQRLVLLTSGLVGALFLLTADIAVRMIRVQYLPFLPFGEFSELPVGILTSLIGGPVFLYVLIRSQRGARG